MQDEVEEHAQIWSLTHVGHVASNSFCKETGALNIFANTSGELQVLSVYEIPSVS